MSFFRSNDIGADLEYIEITGTTDNGNSLSLLATGTNGLQQDSATFTLSNFSGVGYDASKVRAIYILCEALYTPFSATLTDHYAECTYPDSVREFWRHSFGTTGGEAKLIKRIPVADGEVSLDITASRFNTNGAATTTLTVLAVDQV